MSSEWKLKTFEQLCDIKRGASPRPIQDWMAANGIPWVKISDATASASPFINKTAEFIRTDGTSKSVEVFPGDFILSNSATPGIPKFMKIHACIHDGWLLLRNFRELDEWYCYYLLKTERDNLIRKGNGSVFTNLKTEILKKHQVLIPPVCYQKKVASFLKTLDERITLLRETNATLEAIAQAVFKSWFVDFDPVRAKAEGREPEGLDPATAALFPASFQDSPLGPIPAGWRYEMAENWLDVLETGRRPKGGVSGIINGVPSIGAESITKVGEFDYGKTKFVSAEFFEKMKAGKLQSRDVLLYKDGGKPGVFLPRVSMFGDGFPYEVCGINEHVFRVRLKAPYCPAFTYFWLWSDASMHELKHRGGKAAIPGINQSDVKELKLLVPNEEVLEKFDRLTDPLIGKILSNAKQAQTLTQLRDTLLPRLISGQLRLPDADQLVAEVSL